MSSLDVEKDTFQGRKDISSTIPAKIQLTYIEESYVLHFYVCLLSLV